MANDLDDSSTQTHALYTQPTPPTPPPVSEIILIAAGIGIAVAGIGGAANMARLIGPEQIFLASVAAVVTGVALTMSGVVLRRIREICDGQRELRNAQHEQRAHFDERLTRSRYRQDDLAQRHDLLAREVARLANVEQDLLEAYGDQLSRRRQNGRT